MNKVFKVIWSEARNAYVVVSEIAKNHGSKSCSTKKLLTMLIATGVMTCASMAPAMAAPNVDASATVNVGKKAAVNVAENAKVNVKKDAKVNVEESARLSVAEGSNVSVDKNVTIGKGAVSSPYVGQTGNVAIGEKALAWNGNGLQEALMDFGQGGAKVKSFWGIPYGAEIVDGTKLPGSIAIGKNTVARSGSTMIGDHGYTGKIGDTTITPDGNGIMKYNNDVYSTTIGANSFNSGALASVTGVFSIASSKYDGENYKFHAVQNTGATIYGSMNSIESATSDAEYSGIASSVLGFANKTQNANAALIWGTGNEVTNSIESIDIDYNGWNKLSVAEAQQKAIEAMQSSKYAGGSVMAIGGGNKADYAKYSQLTGVQNKVTGTEAKTAKYDFVNGYQNTVTNASDVTVIGIKNEVTADGNKVIGDNHKVSGKDNVIFGSADKVTETTVNNAVVLGHNAKVTGEGGVALGSGSVADRANAVSVGRKDANRQIINVAAGTEDTDAVNVSQLKKVSDTANAGWTLSTNGNATGGTNVTPGAFVDFSGDKNVSVSNNGTAVSVKLNKDLQDIESISNGDAKLALNGAAGTAGIINGQGASVYMQGGCTVINSKVSFDQDGKISGVAAGVNNDDAVNVSQLKKVEEAAGNANKGWNLSTNGVATEATNVKPGDNVDFSGDKNVSVSNDGTAVSVKLNKNLKDIETISNGDAKLALGGLATELTNGQGASVKLFGDATIINGKVNVYNDGRIAGVAAGINDNDAVNVGQLKNSAWKLAANGVLTEAEDVKADDYVDFSGDQNVSVSKDAKDGVKTVKVELNKDLKDIESISNDGASLTLNGTATELTNGKGAAITLFGDTTTINNKVTVYNDGRIAGVAAGVANTDAVNVSQLKAVGATANMGWNLATNGVATEATNVKPGDYVDFSGDKNISVSHDGTKVQVELNKDIDVNYVQTNALNSKYNLSVGTANENGIMPFFVNSTGDFYAAHNKFHVDKDGKVTATAGEIGNVVLKDGKVTATAGEIGNVVLQNGVYTGHSALRDGELFVGDASGNYSQITTKGAKLGKVTVAEDGKISGVAAGAVTADSTDAVNGSQLHAVQQEAGKHTKVVNGSNITVEETNQDGQKTYKVGLNKDILLGDITGKNVSISGTNGTIETTGYIATKDRVYADKGAKLADVDITGDTISNDKSSVKLDKEGTVTVNNKVTIDGNGKVSGVAAGEISNTSTDAVNGSQLKETNDRVTNVENNVKNIQGDITNIKGDITNIKGDITTIKGDVTILGDRVTKVEQEAGKHTKVVNGSNVTVEETDQDGQKTYKVGLNKDLLLGDITGKNVSISGTNGTIETTGSIATKDKIYADKGAKLADIDITGDTISNGQSSVKLDKEGTVTINGKVSVNQNGKVSGVAAGDISATSTDAVNGGQLYETNQAIANNATNISSLSHSISNLDNRVNKVGAGAAALAALHPLDFDPDAKWDFAAGYGNYRGANAAAVGAYYRPNEDTMFSVGGTFGNGENMVNAGVSFKLGSGSSHVSTSRVAMAKEIKELRGELEAMKSAMLDANAGKKIDTSKLQLFPDVPQNHWAYEYVAQLAGNGMIEGYPDGNFAGDRPMTRYEFAAILYRAMTKGAVLSDKILSEFSHELEYFTVDTIAKDKAGNPTIQRVRTVKENKNK